MAGIRGKDTGPEIKIRKALHKKGFRFRLHGKGVPGKPDIILRRYGAVIFVNGCFWHGHDCHLFKWPSTRPGFWRNKINRTRAKDAEVMGQLTVAKWRILVIWECALKGKTRLDFDEVVNDIKLWLTGSTQNKEIKGKPC